MLSHLHLLRVVRQLDVATNAAHEAEELENSSFLVSHDTGVVVVKKIMITSRYEAVEQENCSFSEARSITLESSTKLDFSL